MKRTFFLPLLSLFFMISCRKGLEPQTTEEATQAANYVTPDNIKTAFAKTLAKAVTDPKVCALLKAAALEQFDKDYDVLFQLVKNREVVPGTTLGDYLNRFSTGIDFNTLEETAPLLTVFVPTLSNFSARSWDVNHEVPLIAIVSNDFDEKSTKNVIAYSAGGLNQTMSSRKAPEIPVLVVKDNERMAGVETTEVSSRVNNNTNALIRNRSTAFYLIDELINKQSVNENARNSFLPSFFTPKLGDAYSLSAISQRDYVYYNILNTTDQGRLDNNYVEYIKAIYTNSDNALSYVNDDNASDWTDGALEFQIDILFFNGTSALDKVSKVIIVPADALRTTAENTIPIYELPTPIPIITWDVQKMGDTWKYVINEIDPGTETTLTQSSSSKFGANFTYGASLFDIIKIGIGVDVETTSTNTTTIKTTTGSDFCGEAVVSFTDPVIVNEKLVTVPGHTTFPGGPTLPPATFKLYTATEMTNTGTVGLVVTPGLKN